MNGSAGVVVAMCAGHRCAALTRSLGAGNLLQGPQRVTYFHDAPYELLLVLLGGKGGWEGDACGFQFLISQGAGIE
jgi:hypothetical protein